MLNDREAVELRRLQQAAYAPGGGLTQQAAARLAELEAKRVDASAPLAELRPAPESAPTVEASEDAKLATPDASAGAVFGAPDGRASRRQPWLPHVAAAAALIVGAGIGWLVSEASQAPASITVSPEQQARGEDLPGEGYDLGSLRPLAERDGVIAWYHTADLGERTCLILDDGADETTTCATTELVWSEPLFNAHQSRADGETITYTYGSLMFTVDRRPAVQLDGYESRQDIDGEFTSEIERSIAERLVDEGFLLDALMVVGYRDDVPVWTGSRKPDEYCLVYAELDGAPKAECVDPSEPEQELILEVSEGEGDELGLVVFELVRRSDELMATLVITEQPVEATVIEWSDGQSLNFDDKTGDSGEE